MSPLAPEVVDEKAQTNAISEQQSSVQSEAPYSVVPEREKIFLMLLCSFAALISPLAGSIYFPAIVAIADDLDVSIAKINLTITMYLIFQGLAPSVVASLSDTYGRRPPYIACFMIFLGANIGLAVQDSYPALMVLRCLQSSGSSGTVALGSATVADLATRAERGKYIAYASMGITLGPALGPVIGGLLSHFLGWRAIFWFLVIFSGVFGAFLLVFLPETCRAVVGNGSVPPPVWNRSLWQIARSTVWRSSSRTQRPEPAHETIHTRRKRRNPLIAGAMVARDAEAALILIFGGLLFSGYMAVMSTLAPELESRFGFNSIQIGLCYLPFGVGSLTSRFTLGRLLDLNFRREAKRQNLPIEKNKQQDLTNFNIEIARLTITIPFVYASCAFLVAYGWVLQARTSLAAIVIFLFLSGHTATAAFSSLNTLVVDINPETPATAVAANNLFRCLLGAGAVAVAKPLIDRIGIGWAATFVAGLLVVFSPCLWAVYLRGYRWRRGRRERRERLEQAKGNAAKAMTPGETSKAA
ncbi:MFS general substrate transporter [Aspergillus lucknowensis]|uniref:MFS general substrate transporter n=1 Tax=Aspergillus lucknowensis TaxID=176173 RepID=A0ABR4LNE9_9EURO